MESIQKGSNYFRSDDEFEPLDIHEMFVFYNGFFFHNVLEMCTVQWSQRMTLCAGTCANTYGRSCVIKLSAPLLKFRSANELKQTLIHEMIHAYLFITNPRACITEGGHGKEFKEIMNQINSITGLNITVFHNFNDEVNLYRKHVWRCDGTCMTRPPFFGYVRRAMNRRPQAADSWFSHHQQTCGGNFVKISGPEQKQKKSGKHPKSKEKGSWGTGKSIDEYFKEMQTNSRPQKKQINKTKKTEDNLNQSEQTKTSVIPFQGRGKSIEDYCRQFEQQSSQNNHRLSKNSFK